MLAAISGSRQMFLPLTVSPHRTLPGGWASARFAQQSFARLTKMTQWGSAEVEPRRERGWERERDAERHHTRRRAALPSSAICSATTSRPFGLAFSRKPSRSSGITTYPPRLAPRQILPADHALPHKGKVTIRRSYGFRSHRVLESVLYHSPGKLSEPNLPTISYHESFSESDLCSERAGRAGADFLALLHELMP